MAGPQSKLNWIMFDHSYAEIAWCVSVGNALHEESEAYAEVTRYRTTGYKVEIYRRTYGAVEGSPFHGYSRGRTLLELTPVKSLQEGKKVAESWLIARFQVADLPWREGTLEFERYARRDLETRDNSTADIQTTTAPIPLGETVTLTLLMDDALALSELIHRHLNEESPDASRLKSADKAIIDSLSAK